MLGQRYVYDGKPMLDLSLRQIQAINSIAEVNYPLENYPCECGATEEMFEVLAEKDRYGFPSRTVICRKCGLVMTNPRMTQEAYDDFYNKVYGKLYRNHDMPDEAGFEERIYHGEKIYEYIAREYGRDFHSVLEIGCADGGILHYFREQGYEVTGVDLGGEYIAYGRSRGLDLRQGHSSELINTNKKYDLIILSQVMEHFLTFETELETIHQLLAEQGILYIEVPGIKSLINNYHNDFGLYLQNAHVYCFTLETLESVMNKYGFSLISGNEYVCSLWRYTGEKKDISNNYFCETMLFLYQLEYCREKRERTLTDLKKLEECNTRLVTRIKIVHENMQKSDTADRNELGEILKIVADEVRMIMNVIEILNGETEGLDEGKIVNSITQLSDAVDEGDAGKIRHALEQSAAMFEWVGERIRVSMQV